MATSALWETAATSFASAQVRLVKPRGLTRPAAECWLLARAAASPVPSRTRQRCCVGVTPRRGSPTCHGSWAFKEPCQLCRLERSMPVHCWQVAMASAAGDQIRVGSLRRSRQRWGSLATELSLLPQAPDTPALSSSAAVSHVGAEVSPRACLLASPPRRRSHLAARMCAPCAQVACLHCAGAQTARGS